MKRSFITNLNGYSFCRDVTHAEEDAESIKNTLVCDLPSLLLGIKLVTQHLTLVVR